MMRILLAGLLFVSFAGSGAAWAQSPTEFTYQGELLSGGAPADGVYDIRVLLFASGTGGAAIGSQCVEDVAIVDGRVTIGLDFGFRWRHSGSFLSFGCVRVRSACART